MSTGLQTNAEIAPDDEASTRSCTMVLSGIDDCSLHRPTVAYSKETLETHEIQWAYQ